MAQYKITELVSHHMINWMSDKINADAWFDWVDAYDIIGDSRIRLLRLYHYISGGDDTCNHRLLKAVKGTAGN